MEPTSNPTIVPKSKILYVILIILVIGASVYFLRQRGLEVERVGQNVSTDTAARTLNKVTVENHTLVNGTATFPEDFPKTIPIEQGSVLESVTTKFLDEGARQYSASYRSTKSIAQKYAEYKEYMMKEGYKVTEESNASVKSIFGARSGANLSVAVSLVDGKTLVQLSYLVF